MNVALQWLSCTRHEQICKNGKVTQGVLHQKYSTHQKPHSLRMGTFTTWKWLLNLGFLLFSFATLGYVGSKSFLEELLQVIHQLRQVNPNIIFGGYQY